MSPASAHSPHSKHSTRPSTAAERYVLDHSPTQSSPDRPQSREAMETMLAGVKTQQSAARGGGFNFPSQRRSREFTRGSQRRRCHSRASGCSQCSSASSESSALQAAQSELMATPSFEIPALRPNSQATHAAGDQEGDDMQLLHALPSLLIMGGAQAHAVEQVKAAPQLARPTRHTAPPSTLQLGRQFNVDTPASIQPTPPAHLQDPSIVGVTLASVHDSPNLLPGSYSDLVPPHSSIAAEALNFRADSHLEMLARPRARVATTGRMHVSRVARMPSRVAAALHGPNAGVHDPRSSRHAAVAMVETMRSLSPGSLPGPAGHWNDSSVTLLHSESSDGLARVSTHNVGPLFDAMANFTATLREGRVSPSQDGHTSASSQAHDASMFYLRQRIASAPNGPVLNLHGHLASERLAATAPTLQAYEPAAAAMAVIPARLPSARKVLTSSLLGTGVSVRGRDPRAVAAYTSAQLQFELFHQLSAGVLSHGSVLSEGPRGSSACPPQAANQPRRKDAALHLPMPSRGQASKPHSWARTSVLTRGVVPPSSPGSLHSPLNRVFSVQQRAAAATQLLQGSISPQEVAHQAEESPSIARSVASPGSPSSPTMRPVTLQGTLSQSSVGSQRSDRPSNSPSLSVQVVDATEQRPRSPKWHLAGDVRPASHPSPSLPLRGEGAEILQVDIADARYFHGGRVARAGAAGGISFASSPAAHVVQSPGARKHGFNATATLTRAASRPVMSRSKSYRGRSSAAEATHNDAITGDVHYQQPLRAPEHSPSVVTAAGQTSRSMAARSSPKARRLPDQAWRQLTNDLGAELLMNDDDDSESGDDDGLAQWELSSTEERTPVPQDLASNVARPPPQLTRTGSMGLHSNLKRAGVRHPMAGDNRPALQVATPQAPFGGGASKFAANGGLQSGVQVSAMTMKTYGGAEPTPYVSPAPRQTVRARTPANPMPASSQWHTR